MTGAAYVASSNTIKGLVLGTTHVDTWYSSGKQLYSSHYLSRLEYLCKALLGGEEFLFIKDKDRSEQLYNREGFLGTYVAASGLSSMSRAEISFLGKNASLQLLSLCPDKKLQ